MRNVIGALLAGFLIGIMVTSIFGKVSTKDEPKYVSNEAKNSQIPTPYSQVPANDDGFPQVNTVFTAPFEMRRETKGNSRHYIIAHGKDTMAIIVPRIIDSVKVKSEYQLVLDMDSIHVYDGNRYVGCAIDTAHNSPLMDLLDEDNL